MVRRRLGVSNSTVLRRACQGSNSKGIGSNQAVAFLHDQGSNKDPALVASTAVAAAAAVAD